MLIMGESRDMSRIYIALQRKPLKIDFMFYISPLFRFSQTFSKNLHKLLFEAHFS